MFQGQSDLQGRVLEGLPEHRSTWEEFQLVSRQLKAAMTGKVSALSLVELEDKFQALFTKLSIAGQGAQPSLHPHVTSAGTSIIYRKAYQKH